MPSSTNSKAGLVALIAAMTLSGCGDYLSNRDRISPHTGDATASNTAIQTIDPWPPKSYDTNIDLGG